MGRTIKVLKIDQTDHWCDEVAKKARRIFGVYVYDADYRVHLCEMTASYECHFVESQTDYPNDFDEAEEEKLHDQIMTGDAQTDPVCYWHCNYLDRAPEFHITCLPKGPYGVYTLTDGDGDDDHDEAIEEALEYARGNAI